jgi:DNA polymerase-3 subunit beta
MNQFHIKQSTLDAMLLIAAKKDIRYYLNGVYIEFNDQITRAVGCDGHKLGIYQNAAPDNRGSGHLTVPRDVIENLPKKCDVLTFTQNDTGAGWTINTGATTVSFTPYDDTYPDFRRVVHGIQTAGTTGVAAGFNLDYLNQFEKCGNLLGGSKLRMGNRLRLHHNGDAAGLVLLNCVDGFAGVVMPLRDSVGSTGALFPLELTSDLTATNNELAAA